MKITSLSTRISGKGQCVDYVEHLVLTPTTVGHGGQAKLRIRLHFDTYVFQSWGKVERWNGSEWREVVAMDGHELRGNREIGHRYEATDAQRRDAFLADRDELIALTKEVLL